MLRRKTRVCRTRGGETDRNIQVLRKVFGQKPIARFAIGNNFCYSGVVDKKSVEVGDNHVFYGGIGGAYDIALGDDIPQGYSGVAEKGLFFVVVARQRGAKGIAEHRPEAVAVIAVIEVCFATFYAGEAAEHQNAAVFVKKR